jgi:Rad52/22 family double-strand break repair protein
MNGANGDAHEHSDFPSFTPAAAFAALPGPQFSAERVKELVAALEVPFDGSQIVWRVTNTSRDKSRGQVIPYADQRAYTDRLNALFTPAGWTRKYTIHTSANFERSRDQKTAAKVLVTCELTVFGLGSHSATGEEWADNDNAGTAAEAQSFKRACACFGLGRYLYYFTGTWVDLDDHKRPKSVPQLAGWATPAGWLQGLRPSCASEQGRATRTLAGNGGNSQQNGNDAAGNTEILREIEQMERVVGKRMYRGLLKSVARVWNPREIPGRATRRKVLEQMRAAERGLHRAQAARQKAGLAAYAAVLGSMKLSSLEQVDNLKTLQEIVVALEQKAKSRA